MRPRLRNVLTAIAEALTRCWPLSRDEDAVLEDMRRRYQRDEEGAHGR